MKSNVPSVKKGIILPKLNIYAISGDFNHTLVSENKSKGISLNLMVIQPGVLCVCVCTCTLACMRACTLTHTHATFSVQFKQFILADDTVLLHNILQVTNCKIPIMMFFFG
jgi:hypothetical protein